MYQPLLILAAIDHNKWHILTLCSAAMIFNYIWFFAAVRQGFRDKVYPVPIISTLFWLVGDGSVVVRWATGHNAYDHWYLNQFSMSLILTVACELTFLFLILKFGRKELMPQRSQAEFTTVIMIGLAVTLISWTYINANLLDPLNITYFNLANMVGPAASACLLMRRGSPLGTSTLIWVGYAIMLTFFYTSCILWYGAPFASPLYVLFDVVNIASAVALAVVVHRYSIRRTAMAPNSGRAAIA